MKYATSTLGRSSLLVLSVAVTNLIVALAVPERETLLQVYASSNGNRWKKNTGWQSAAESSDNASVEQLPVCSWHGVTCANGKKHDDEGITSLDLSHNHLSGHVHKALWSLPHLIEVNFQGNSIKDAGFEGFGNVDSATASPVQNVVLTENRLTHVTGVSSAPESLRELRLSSNAFNGKFPDELTKLNKLKVLHVSHNPGISGALPSDIGKMQNLRDLDLSYTSLRGVLPSEIGELSLLQHFGMDETQVKGPFPEEVGDLTQLRYLSIQNNDADSGKITGPLPSFANLGNLRELYLNGNAFTGTIPPNFLEKSVGTERLVTVGLKNNNLTGELPSELSRFKKLQIDVQGNRLNNVAVELCEMKKWNGGLVGAFGCDAILCPRDTFNAQGRREKEDEVCQSCHDGYGPHHFVSHLGSDRCVPEPEPANNDSDLMGRGPTEVKSGADRPAPSQSEQIQAGEGLNGVTRFVILIGLAVPIVILYALRKAHIRSEEGKESIEILGPDKTSVAPTIESIEQSLRDVQTLDRCII